MSYEIIYDKQFIKTKDSKLFIPMILAGSNNCYEHSGRRARSWFPWLPNNKLLYTKGELLAYVENMKDNILNRGDNYYSSGERPTEDDVKKNFGYYTSIAVNGHWRNTTYGAVKSVFNAGCDKALTIEELMDDKVNVVVRNSYYNEKERERLGIEAYSRIVSSDSELLEAIEECNNRFKDTHIRATIEFLGMYDDKPKWIRKRRFKKDTRKKELVTLDKYYTVMVDGRYLAKHTKNGYRYSFSPYLKFANEVEAKRKVKEFNNKYGREYSVEIINERAQIYV